VNAVTITPERPDTLDARELLSELDAYLQGLEGVSNYVRGTFGLFDIARRRRPRTLLHRA